MEILQKLKKYFEDNSEEQILADWESTKNSDCIDAPTVDEFLLYNVIASNCRHCDNKLCDAQRFNNVCFECGKKPV
jgi:hypothetical protein